MGASLQFQGWVPQIDRTPEQNKISDNIIGAMPKFAIGGPPQALDGKRLVLWDITNPILGKHVPTLYQRTGSCVGNGHWTVCTYLMLLEIAAGEAETFQEIFLPYHYGRGRLHAGMSGRGEGSTGSGQAEAIRVDGILINALDGLPKPSGGDDALTWGASVEMEWSAGNRISDKWIQEGRKHPCKTTAMVTSYKQVRDSLLNRYPVAVCSNVGFEGRFKEDRGRIWGGVGGSWNHCMCFIGVDDDPARPGVYCRNSWSSDAHPKPIDGAPPGGFWVDADVVDRMVRQEDSFAFSQFEGFPDQSWMLI